MRSVEPSAASCYQQRGSSSKQEVNWSVMLLAAAAPVLLDERQLRAEGCEKLTPFLNHRKHGYLFTYFCWRGCQAGVIPLFLLKKYKINLVIRHIIIHIIMFGGIRISLQHLYSRNLLAIILFHLLFSTSSLVSLACCLTFYVSAFLLLIIILIYTNIRYYSNCNVYHIFLSQTRAQ